VGIYTLDFIHFWHYLTWHLYSIELKRINDLLIGFDLMEIEIVACARKVHRSYAFDKSGQALNLPRNYL
jgi:hypothetical protein